MRTLAVVILFLSLGIGNAFAGVVARIDISSQRMTVSENGRVLYTWAVSTARQPYHTPRGTFRPIRMHKMWYSRKYHNSPMPHSIFFYGGYAIHGTDAVSNLGRPASHGCIRLHPSNARTLFNLVKSHGSGNTRIVLQN
jgi:lipoprotein-anchoring transpeptidase ErfK/SrfK